MIFPFGDNPPIKDYYKVRYNFVDTKTVLQRRLLLLLLKIKGYRISENDRYYQDGYLAIGVPVNKRNDFVCSGFNIYTRAEQTYHGAKTYRIINI
jgi:hypothetical protein